MSRPPAPLNVSVDARPLDIGGLRAHGIGRYAHGLLGPLAEVADARGGRLTLLRERARGPSPFGPVGGRQRVLRRPWLPARGVELAEQALLPIDLRRLGPEVHHALSLHRTPLAAPAARVVTMHDVVPLLWPERYVRTGLAHRILYRAVERAQAVICPSRAAAADVLRHLDLDPARVTVVPEAADARFRPTDASALRRRLALLGPYLLYVGDLADPRKDVEGLVDAFAAWTRAQDRHEALVIAGPASAAARALERRARDLRAHVLVTGFVPDDDLPALMSGARCLVTASRYEGFGLPALEAIACGTPVVAYDAGAISETAGPGALLAPAGDGPALMAAAARVCDEPGVAERLSAAGRRHAEGFSWRRAAESTWEVYEAVAAERRLARP